jgi:hypothetical protein
MMMEFFISLLDTVGDFADTDPLPGIVAVGILLAAGIGLAVWPLKPGRTT